MKPTCLHFQILYLKQRTFSFLEQKSRIKLSSLSLLMDTTRIATTRIATSLLRRIAKAVTSSHTLFTYSCACYLPIKFWRRCRGGKALLFKTKDFSLFLCVGEVPRSLLSREVKEVAKDIAQGFICPQKIRVKASFFD